MTGRLSRRTVALNTRQRLRSEARLRQPENSTGWGKPILLIDSGANNH
jgi:hypothetical protein